MGVVIALLLITVVVVGVFKFRMVHRSGSHALRPGFLPVKEKTTVPVRSESDELFEKDDKNPDIIPANKGKLCVIIFWECKSFSFTDSDYQLGSAAQTPGLNNCGTAVEYEVPSSQHITPLAEAYIARDRAYGNQHVSSNFIYIV